MDAGQQAGGGGQIGRGEGFDGGAGDVFLHQPDDAPVAGGFLEPTEGTRRAAPVEPAQAGVFGEPGAAIAARGQRDLEFLGDVALVHAKDGAQGFLGAALAQEFPALGAGEDVLGGGHGFERQSSQGWPDFASDSPLGRPVKRV